MARRSITGFDPKKLAASSGLFKRDPWYRNEIWRHTGPFTRWNRFKGTLPGFGWASGAFAVYLVYEAIFLGDSQHHGAEHSETGH